PIAIASSLSDSGSQFTPPSSECQTPPVAVPSQMSLGLLGLTAIAEARPETPPLKKPSIGAGPIGNQLVPWISADAGVASRTATANTIPRNGKAALSRWCPIVASLARSG